MLVKIEVGGVESTRVAIFEAESVQAAADKARDETQLFKSKQSGGWWVSKQDGIPDDSPHSSGKLNRFTNWPTTAYYLWFEPGFHGTVEEAALDDEHATWICACEIQLGEYWDPELNNCET